MVFWKRELRELEASGHRFEDIFRIFSTEFTDTPFSLQFTAGQTQRMSYAELTALTNRLARVLHAHFAGQEGAFLAIRMENSPLWVAAFFGTLMAFCLYMTALRLISPVIASILSLGEPVSAYLLSVLVMGLDVGLIEGIGVVMVLATVVLLAKTPRKSSEGENIAPRWKSQN